MVGARGHGREEAIVLKAVKGQGLPVSGLFPLIVVLQHEVIDLQSQRLHLPLQQVGPTGQTEERLIQNAIVVIEFLPQKGVLRCPLVEVKSGRICVCHQNPSLPYPSPWQNVVRFRTRNGQKKSAGPQKGPADPV